MGYIKFIDKTLYSTLEIYKIYGVHQKLYNEDLRSTKLMEYIKFIDKIVDHIYPFFFFLIKDLSMGENRLV